MQSTCKPAQTSFARLPHVIGLPFNAAKNPVYPDRAKSELGRKDDVIAM